METTTGTEQAPVRDTREDVALAGGKGANLGEMTHAGLPIPPGFVVTARMLECWASAFGQRGVAYRKGQGLTELPSLAELVQALVDSARSGVMFTADLATGETRRLIIEAAWGLGEVVVGGQVAAAVRRLLLEATWTRWPGASP